MKKFYTEEKYKKHNLTKIRKGYKKRNKEYDPTNKLLYARDVDIKQIVHAPEDFRLIQNTEECLLFFRKIRSPSFLSYSKTDSFVEISLENVKKIDYGTISVLTAISDDLKYKGAILRGSFPTDESCKNFISESGFLNNMYDLKGNKFPRNSKSDLIFFEKGAGKLSTKDNIRITEMVKNVVEHLTGNSMHCLPIKTLILEICGNSIEWGATKKRQWLFGVKYEDEKVIFTVTDVGKGILKTLHKKFDSRLKDIFLIKSDLEILIGAFDKKYESSSREVNRNKGLPSIRIKNEEQNITNLTVITNNVILHFNDKSKSRTFRPGSPRYKGTFYQWEMNSMCLSNIF